jgi:hypothetical protein
MKRPAPKVDAELFATAIDLPFADCDPTVAAKEKEHVYACLEAQHGMPIPRVTPRARMPEFGSGSKGNQQRSAPPSMRPAPVRWSITNPAPAKPRAGA